MYVNIQYTRLMTDECMCREPSMILDTFNRAVINKMSEIK